MICCAISGWNGFLAQHLDKALRKQDIQVVGIPRAILYNMVELNNFLHINRPDYILHLAAYGNKFSQDNDLETLFANVMILMNLLEASRDIEYKAFVNFSTSSVMLPYETFYSATKAAGERLVRAFVNKYNKPVFSVRPFTVIGTGEPSEHLIPKLIESCLLGTEIPFVNEPVHDYIDVDDLSEAVVMLLQLGDKLQGQVIDIGTGVATTNRNIRMIVEKITEKKANIKLTKNLRPYDSKDWKALPAVLEYLGWIPRHSIEQTIQKMVKG